MSSKLRNVLVFDTTLRDGEQSPGASMNPEEKLRMARQLEALGVDVIEAGFPAASKADFKAIQRIAQEVRGTRVAAIARAAWADIDCAGEALRDAAQPRLHVFMSTSDVHLRHQLKMSRGQVLKATTMALERAVSLVEDVEFSAMDATRTDKRFLRQVLERAIACGALTINIADTVGYAIPAEFGELVTYLISTVTGIDKVLLSVHCHDDLGQAVANTLAAVKSGAQQVKCTINGIGERAGNAALEEVVMALETRRDYFGAKTSVQTERLYETSRLLTDITGIAVQPNKAIVGANAFAHESGIHQDGFIKERSTYEIIAPRSAGAPKSHLVLGRHSGRHGLSHRLRELGCILAPSQMEELFARFKELADVAKEVTDSQLEALALRAQNGESRKNERRQKWERSKKAEVGYAIEATIRG
jgi:2-isopropylmalate synthase